jgi:hypothetical protein
MPKKRVQFDTIEIWEFGMVLGDNPSVSDGPPVSMSYKPWRRKKCTVKTFEYRRLDRRSKESLRLSTTDREGILRRIGYSRRQIQRCSMRAKVGRNQRMLTIQQMILARKHAPSEGVLSKRGNSDTLARKHAPCQGVLSA